jgi:16S rRNA processing protein RimM
MTHLRAGQLIKAHGFKGEIQVELYLEDPEVLENMESVFVEINQKLVPFFIEEIRIADKRAIIKFEDVDSEEDVKSILRRYIFIPAAEEEGEDDEREGDLSYSALIGFKVVDARSGELGMIEDYIEKAGQDLLVMKYHEKQIYIPIDLSIILKIQPKKKVVQVNLPEGLLEL